MRLVAILLLFVSSAFAQYTESVLYSFDSSATPFTGLVMDASGNLYGAETTASGSDIYKVTPFGQKSIFHAFPEGSGGDSSDWLTIDKTGTIYGPTWNDGLGFGTIFKITADGTFSTIYQFGQSNNDGKNPSGPVTLDALGNIYGVTSKGGTGFGTVYEIDATGKETVLFQFKGGRNGSLPFDNVIRDSAGNLYGIACATNQGCTGYEVFKLNPQGVLSKVGNLHSIHQGSFIARTSAGNFYGYDYWNGPWEISSKGAYSAHGFGDGNSFVGRFLCASGVLYGTAMEGGANANFAVYGDGLAFVYDPASNSTTVLYDFGAYPTDAALPISGLIADPSGNLYGVSDMGGTFGWGTIFKLSKQ